MERQLVKFAKTWPPYNAGEIAAFAPKTANWLAEQGYGSIYLRPDPSKCITCGQSTVPAVTAALSQSAEVVSGTGTVEHTAEAVTALKKRGRFSRKVSK